MPGTSCPTDDALQAWLEQQASPPEAAALEAHLEACAECRQVAEASRGENTPSALAPGSTVGRYVLQRVVGRGGMGLVYAARDPDLNRLVALKLLRPEIAARNDGYADRLWREAQAMARLSHPNVIPVYDVARIDGQLFIAMELVEGQTLRAWLAGGERPWREVLSRFLDAGRGLAAAHGAGLIHRDFKPENVLLGCDGRVRVTDFGLARAPGLPSDETATISTDPGLEARLTRTGAIVGTPLYMAPEQFHDEPLDGRADQFGFAAALYEALYRQRPFAGKTLAALRPEVLAGRVRPPPRKSPVPRRIHKALVRALAPHRDDRWPDMDALLLALERAGRTRRLPPLATALAGTALLAGLGLLVWPRLQRARCARSARGWTALWQPALRQKLASRAPPDAPSPEALDRRLNRFGEAWARARVESCEACKVRGEQPDAVYRQRSACLDLQLAQAQVLVEALAQGEPEAWSQAWAATAYLPSPERCANLLELAAIDPLPAAPAEREALARLAFRLTLVRGLLDTGRAEEAERELTALASSAHTLRYRPLEAEVLAELARTQLSLRRPQANATYAQALQLAKASGAERVVVRASAVMLRLSPSSTTELDATMLEAQRALERLGGEPELRVELLASEAALLVREERNREALDRARSAVTLADASPEVSPDTRVGALLRLASSLRHAGALEAGLATAQRAVTLADLEQDPRDLVRISCRGELGVLLILSGRLEEALRVNLEALALAEKAMGPDSPRLNPLLSNITDLELRMGRLDDAAAHVGRALRLVEAAHWSQLGIGSGLRLGAAEVERRLGHTARALELAREELARREHAVGPASPLLSEALLAVGKAQLDQGQAAEALTSLERAATLQTVHWDKSIDADLHFALGRALEASPRERERGRQLVEQAHQESAGINPSLAHEIEAWLARTPGGVPGASVQHLAR